MTAEEATVHDDWRATSAGRYLDGRIKSLILDLAAPRAGERLLDIGCGSGDHLGLFRKKGCDVTGIDPSPFLLDLARQRLETAPSSAWARRKTSPSPTTSSTSSP